MVTGANKGVGKEIARRLSREEDAAVTVLACRDLSLAEAAREELLRPDDEGNVLVKGEIVTLPLDLVDPESARRAAATMRERYGRLDVLVNNAAVCFNDPTLYGKVEHTPFERQADITIRTNYFGTLATIEAMVPLLSESRTVGRVVNVASAAGRLGILPPGSPHLDTVTSPDLTTETLSALMSEFVEAAETGTHAARGFPNTCYGASKLGLIALTRVLARDRPDLVVTSVDPGYCRTDQNNNQGFVSPSRGAVTPYLLATIQAEDVIELSGRHLFEEREISW